MFTAIETKFKEIGDCPNTKQKKILYKEAIECLFSLANKPNQTKQVWILCQFKIGECFQNLGDLSDTEEAIKYYTKALFSMSIAEPTKFKDKVRSTLRVVCELLLNRLERVSLKKQEDLLNTIVDFQKGKNQFVKEELEKIKRHFTDDEFVYSNDRVMANQYNDKNLDYISKKFFKKFESLKLSIPSKDDPLFKEKADEFKCKLDLEIRMSFGITKKLFLFLMGRFQLHSYRNLDNANDCFKELRLTGGNNELLCSNLKIKENDIKKEKEAIKKEEQGRKKRIKTFKDMEEYDFQPNNYKDFISLVKGVLSEDGNKQALKWIDDLSNKHPNDFKKVIVKLKAAYKSKDWMDKGNKEYHNKMIINLNAVERMLASN